MTQQNTIFEDLVFRDAAAMGGLKRVTNQVGLLSRAVTGVKSALGGAGGALGLAGLFGVASAIHSVSELYEKVRRLRAVAGVSAAEGHALIDSLELTGAAEVAENVVIRLARLGQRASGAGKESMKLRAQLRGVGVDMQHGVTKSLLSMSSAVKAGKLGIADMSKTFKIPLAQAATLMAALQQGPAKIRAIMNDTLHGSDLVDDAALESFERMQQGKRELADAWEGLVGTVYKSLLPGVTAIVKGLKSGLEAAAPIAEAIGTTLAKHMDLVVFAAKAYLGYLVAAKAVALTTGRELGGIIRGQLGSMLTFRRGPGAVGGISRAAAMGNLGGGFAAAGQMAAIRMQFAGRTGVLARVGERAALGLGRISPSLGLLASSGVSIRNLGMVLGKFSVAGLAVGVATKAFGILKNDIGGHRTRIVGLLNEIVGKFSGLGKIIIPVVNLIGKIFGGVITVTAHALLYIFEGVLKAVSFTLTILRAVVNVMYTLVTSPWWSIRHPVKLFTNSWAKAAKATAEMLGQGDKKTQGKGTTGTPPTTYNDFRGSKFDIRQNFAEGFDPGRVSVGLMEDLARAADRRLMSGFAPTLAVRGGG